MLPNTRLGGVIVVFTLLVFGLPSPPAFVVGGEKDKDAIIKMLKEQVERQEKEAKVRQQELELIQSRNKELLMLVKDLADLQKTLRQAKADLVLKLKDLEIDAEARRKEHQVKIKEIERQISNAQTALAQALLTNKRQADEIAVLNKTITDREKLIVQLEADFKVIRVQAQNFEALARARQIQNEKLLEQIRELTTTRPPFKGERDPNAPNPPAVNVTGKIEKLDPKDPTLVQISLGTDHGVNKNHTLDVYRIKPEPKYLGMIRILEAYQQKSVAQVIKVGAAAPMLREGDLVTSKLGASKDEPKKGKDDKKK
jgi:hypothetical protein